ncbi:polyketide synthase [Roseiconus nitratireducens]|uniref:Polyketide synthase n=1 Tax=Roseiconus nitratireducens TaxID=2605748 RepID=A0A5M6DFC7_9BACT|nr:polyketide synthase [Roseiconus nitratireducens]KAA5546093.1 polyketide synthase [Roseiconus nitratireducens]
MLDPQLQSLLQSLRGRVRRYVVVDSLLAIVAVILIGFWVGYLIDYLPVLLGGSEMPRLARAILLGIVVAAVAAIAVRLLVARLRRPLPDDSLALLIERHHPQLGGRLVTAVQLNQPGRHGDAHSPDLLQMVHRQASDRIGEVDPGRVFRHQPLFRKALVAGPLLLLAIVFAAISPQGFARAAGRLSLLSDARWPRRAKLEMVGVDLPIVTASGSQEMDPERIEFVDGVMRLPKGSSGVLRIRAVADDAEVPSLCTVYYRSEDGTRGQSNMRRVGRQRDGYQAFILDGAPLSNLSDSFEFSVQGLDDRLTDFRIEAVPPPVITQMDVKIRYPKYLQSVASTEDSNTFDFETPYQAGLRVSEGSDVLLQAVSSEPLGEVDVVLEAAGVERPAQDLTFSSDRRVVTVSLKDFDQPTAVKLVPADQTGISAQAPFRYFLGAVMDEPPTVELALKGIQSAVTPIARLPIECRVSDDYGVESLQAFVAPKHSTDENEPAAGPEDGSTEDDDATAQNVEDASAEQTTLAVSLRPDREGNASTVVDLRELVNDGSLQPIEPGGAISVYAEARDGYNLDGQHLTSSELYRLQVVTPEELLSLLERRELGLRTRLEQTVTEAQGLRDQLARFRAERFEVSPPNNPEASSESDQDVRQRELQILRLRVQQSRLQASKAKEELTGIAESLDDILQEMVNNRVDSADRQERLGSGVRDPLRRIADVSMEQLGQQIAEIESAVDQPELAMQRTEAALQTADKILLDLTAVLEKMLDLESYNEILDLVRGLIDDQEKLKEDTQKERKKRVLDLFND